MQSARTTWHGLEFEHDAVTSGPIRDDIVLPPSPTSRTLAALMVRRRCRRALDIGVGCGALALLAAQVADDVIATDVNRRALAYTQRNAAANGISNVTCREGSFTDPVRDLRFDLIVGNLPFVISPRSSLTFRDGDPDRARDGSADVSPTAVAAAAEVLAPDGVAEFLVNWVVTDRARPYDTPVSWVRATGCGGLVLLHSLQTPDDYVTSWTKSSDDDPDEWSAHLRARGAVAVANGAVIVHRPNPPVDRPVIRAAPMSSPRGQGGDQVERILHAGSPSDLEVLGGRPRLVPSTITGEQARDGRTIARVRADDSCGVTATVPDEQVRLLQQLDGTRHLDDAVGSWDRDDRPGSADALHARTADALATVRKLVLHGLMEIDDAGTAG